MATSWLVFFKIFFHFVVIYMTYSSNANGGQETQHRKHQIGLNVDHKSLPIAFGGVLNLWMHGVQMNDTDARRAVKYAVKYARRRNPDSFPSKSDDGHVQCLHHAKNIKKMKVIYTIDDKNPAMFSVMDPVQLQPVTVPIIWGFMYHFNVDVFPPDKSFRITHRFSVLEYTNQQFYILEHSFFCQGEKYNTGDGTFGATCVVPFALNFVSGSAETRTDQSDSMAQSNSKSKLAVQPGPENSSTSGQEHSHPLPGVPMTNITLNSDQVKTDISKHNQKHSSRSSSLQDNSSNVPSSRKSLFSILSYNIWNTNVQGNSGNIHLRYAERIKHLAELCQTLHPDVIAFQEVRFEDGKGGSLGPNQLRHLSLLLKDYQYVFQPGQVQSSNLPGLVIEGVSIFSRHPITFREHILLSRNPSDAADGHQRVLLHAEINLPFVGKINVLNTHLSLSHEARLRTVQEMGSYMQSLHGPVFLAGDFNAEAHNEEVRYLGGKHQINGKKLTGFHDIWELHHGNHHQGFTFNTLDSKLSKRIDLIFMKEQDDLAISRVKIIDDKTRGRQAASDHLGLLGRFAMQT